MSAPCGWCWSTAATRRGLGVEIDTSLPGRRIVRVLDRLVAAWGKPAMIVSDNGTELTCNAMLKWTTEQSIAWHYIAPGKPMQNAPGLIRGSTASVASKTRLRRDDECLNEHVFASLAEARRVIEASRADYNEVRPHSSLGYQTPEEFADAWATKASTSDAPDASACHRARDRQGQAPLGARKCASLTVPARDGEVDVRPGRKNGSAGAEQKNDVADQTKNRFNL